MTSPAGSGRLATRRGPPPREGSEPRRYPLGRRFPRILFDHVTDSTVQLSVVAPGAHPGPPAGGLGHALGRAGPHYRIDRTDDSPADLSILAIVSRLAGAGASRASMPNRRGRSNKSDQTDASPLSSRAPAATERYRDGRAGELRPSRGPNVVQRGRAEGRKRLPPSLLFGLECAASAPQRQSQKTPLPGRSAQRFRAPRPG